MAPMAATALRRKSFWKIRSKPNDLPIFGLIQSQKMLVALSNTLRIPILKTSAITRSCQRSRFRFLFWTPEAVENCLTKTRPPFRRETLSDNTAQASFQSSGQGTFPFSSAASFSEGATGLSTTETVGHDRVCGLGSSALICDHFLLIPHARR